MRQLSKYILAAVLVLGAVIPVRAQDKTKAEIYFFRSNGCPHCAAEKVFLDGLGDRITVHDYEVSSSFRNAQIFAEVGSALDADISGVPFTVIGSQKFVGWADTEEGKARFLAAIQDVEEGRDLNILGKIIDGDSPSNPTFPEKVREAIPETLTLPVFGKINPRSLSLPALTVAIAFLDGFNPCAMWVLLFLISLLLGMENRRKMWLLGGTFIAASGFVYFLLMSAWLNLFLLIGYVYWVQLGIGLFAIVGGSYTVYKAWKNRDGGCEVTGAEDRRKTFDKIRGIIEQRNLLLALGGIILLAFAINIVEALCSAGLPAVYTEVLTLSQLPIINYYAYLFLYIFIFMLDDMVIFVIAMVTLKAVGVESKYSRYSHIIGGVIMLAIGLTMMFKPELLRLGS
jgi:glutaredoxin